MTKRSHKLSQGVEYNFTDLRSPPRMHIQAIRRNDIPSLHSVTIDDKVHYLGLLKDFHQHPKLDSFIPKDGRLSLSWVHLGKDEMLALHVHPIKSMIIICKGQVESIGELSTSLHEGDILLVPPGCEHGLIGSGTNGFWGLSVQFEERGLYEDPSVPLARFIEDPAIRRDIPNDNECLNLSSLLRINEIQKKNFAKNPLFSFLNDHMKENVELRDLFLDYFQVWSDAFQKMVLTRDILCDNPIFQKISGEHLIEEFGHNRQLANDRGRHTQKWDAILNATTNWFPWKVMTLDDLETHVFVHLVVEASASIFYTHIPSFIGESIQSSHFKDHQKLDTEHEEFGLFLLEGLTPEQYTRLSIVQKEGWEMLNQMYNRICELLHLGLNYAAK